MRIDLADTNTKYTQYVFVAEERIRKSMDDINPYRDNLIVDCPVFLRRGIPTITSLIKWCYEEGVSLTIIYHREDGGTEEQEIFNFEE